MTTSSPSDPAINSDALAALLKAAGDPLRLQVLRVLRSNAFGALELSTIFAMRQNAMSHHLKLLSKTGLVMSRREGTHLFYRRSTGGGASAGLRQAIYDAADSIALPADLQHRLDTIQAERAATSQAFFRANADKFREQQDLIASYPQYGEAVLHTLDNLALPGRNTALEVGPGEGELLPGLHQRFDQVLALDNSSEMLARAKAHTDELGLEGIAFCLGDTGSPALADTRADAITLNMVLHHTPAPGAVVADLADRLTLRGVLVVTELCSHDQDWAREACGDLWLGFEPEELGHWARSAGLSDEGSEFLALKNGFTVQIRRFRKPAATPQSPHE